MAETDEEERAEDPRIARARRRGRTFGTVVMVLFGTWFVLTTVYEFAVDVFGPMH